MPKLIRWSGFVPFIVIIAAVCVFNMLFLDSLLKNAAISAAEDLNGAAVEIDSFDLQFLNAALISEGIRVVDKNNSTQNLFEIGRVQFDFDANLLSRKKIVVDTINVEGIKLGTSRPGSVLEKEAEKEKATKPPEKKPEIEKDSESFDLSSLTQNIDVEKLADELNIPVVSEAEALRKLILEKKEYWDKNIALVSDTDEIRKSLTRVRKIDLKSYKSLKDLPRLREDIKLVQETHKKINERIKEIQELQKAFNEDRKLLDARIKDIKKLSSQGASAMLLPGGSKKNLARNILNAIFDDSLVERGFYFLDLYEKYKGLIPKKQKIEKMKEGDGVVVDFLKAGEVPFFYARKIVLSGENDDVRLTGVVRGLGSDLSYSPVDFELKYIEHRRPCRIKGRLELKNEKVVGQALADIREFSFDNLDVSRSKILNAVSGKANIALKFKDAEEKLTLDMSVIATDKVSFLLKTEKMNAEVKSILNKALTDVKNLSLNLRLEKSGQKTVYSMKSSVYKIVGGRLNRILNKRLDEVKKNVEKQARRKAEKILAPLKLKLAALNGQGLNKALADLDPARKDLGDKQKKLDKNLKKTADKKIKDMLKMFKK